jgi:hypothetical protein
MLLLANLEGRRITITRLMTFSYRPLDPISFTFSYRQSTVDGLIGFSARTEPPGVLRESSSNRRVQLHLAAVAVRLFSRYKDTAGWRLARRFLVNVLWGRLFPVPPTQTEPLVHTPPLHKNYAITLFMIVYEFRLAHQVLCSDVAVGFLSNRFSATRILN